MLQRFRHYRAILGRVVLLVFALAQVAGLAYACPQPAQGDDLHAGHAGHAQPACPHCPPSHHQSDSGCPDGQCGLERTTTAAPDGISLSLAQPFYQKPHAIAPVSRHAISNPLHATWVPRHEPVPDLHPTLKFCSYRI